MIEQRRQKKEGQTMRDYIQETKDRIEFIRGVLKEAGADGIVFGNSGGKDCALVGILCKMACDNTLGLIMPCASKRNYEEDRADAEAIADRYDIAARFVDLSDARNALASAAGEVTRVTPPALANIAPRMRMTALYTIAASENRLVAGTGNRSERYMGYFTKWGDGAFDFNPIADLTVTEVYEFLKHLGAPERIVQKVPSAGLFEGQTDEDDMGIAYRDIDNFLLNGEADDENLAIIEKYHASSAHKRRTPLTFAPD